VYKFKNLPILSSVGSFLSKQMVQKVSCCSKLFISFSNAMHLVGGLQLNPTVSRVTQRLWKKDGNIKDLVPVLIINPNRCTNFSNLLWNKTLHVSDSSPVHHKEIFTVHTAMIYVTHVL